MGKARIIDPHLFSEYYARWRDDRDRDSRGEVVRDMMRVFNMSEGAIRKRLRDVQNGESIFAIAAMEKKRPSSPRREAARKHRLNAAMIIAAIKEAGSGGRDGYPISTEMAMHIAVNEKYLKPEELPENRSTMDRWLAEFDLTHVGFRSSEREHAEFVARYPGEVYFADATPLNRYFLKLTEERIIKQHIIKGDTHLDDILQRDGLCKIWCYYVVDLYSKSFYTRAYASRGENTADWLDTFTRTFLHKGADYPMEGAPDLIYSDRGSGLVSKDMRNFLHRLEIRTETHLPGNPSAKGLVEGRISGFKRSFEPALNLLGDRLNSMEQLNRFLYLWARKKCTDERKFEKFLSGSQSHPVRKVTMKNIHDATVKESPRKLDAYRCVSVKWSSAEKSKQYRVLTDLPKGTEMYVYKDLRGNVTAQDVRTGRLYPCDPMGKLQVQFGEFRTIDGRKRLGKTEAEERREEVLVEAGKIRRSVNIHSILPDESNIRMLPPQGTNVETYSPAAPETFETPDDAKTYMVLTSGVSFDRIDDELKVMIETSLERSVREMGHISKTLVLEITKILQGYSENEARENQQ